MDTIRVFVNDLDHFGNKLSIVTDQFNNITPIERQRLANQFSTSETVFVNDPTKGQVFIYNPTDKVDFSGYALLGTNWYLRQKLNTKLTQLSCRQSSFEIGFDHETAWLLAKTTYLPGWNIIKLDSVHQVLSAKKDDMRFSQHTLIWAWQNETLGLIRARTFAADWGIIEDEANGSGSMLLCANLNRSIKVIHGQGSVIDCQPINSQLIKLSGRCAWGEDY